MESFTCVIKASNAASIAYVNTTEKYCRGVKAGDEKMNMRINTQVLMPKRWHRLHPGLWKQSHEMAGGRFDGGKSNLVQSTTENRQGDVNEAA